MFMKDLSRLHGKGQRKLGLIVPEFG
jgi:hypothetical protein